MATAKLVSQTTIAGLAINADATRTGEGSIGQDLTLATGVAGTLSGRTDDNTGVVTATAGHGIVTSDKVDVYWSGGSRFGMTATVSTNDISVDGGAGDNLPAEDAVVVIAKQEVIDFDVDGALIKLIAACCYRRVGLDFQQADGTSIVRRDIPARECWSWLSDQGITNPFGASVIGKITASCGEVATDAALQIGCIYDSVS